MSLFPARDASGTAWLPDASPMYGVSRQSHQWAVMLHGNSFVQYLQEFAPEPRGAHQAGSINWFMVMARRSVGAGRIGVRTMFSLEPWTIPGCGYPDLLATGELCDGDDIHDRQHPHDLFMEAAVEYDRPVSSTVRWQIYGGPAGEPALGPAAFPHRLSAMPNPIVAAAARTQPRRHPVRRQGMAVPFEAYGGHRYLPAGDRIGEFLLHLSRL